MMYRREAGRAAPRCRFGKLGTRRSPSRAAASLLAVGTAPWAKAASTTSYHIGKNFTQGEALTIFNTCMVWRTWAHQIHARGGGSPRGTLADAPENDEGAEAHRLVDRGAVAGPVRSDRRRWLCRGPRGVREAVISWPAIRWVAFAPPLPSLEIASFQLGMAVVQIATVDAETASLGCRGPGTALSAPKNRRRRAQPAQDSREATRV